jgi:hypothetical protein
MYITRILFYSWSLLFICNIVPHSLKRLQIENLDQVRETAVQDFSRTTLCERDSVFLISFYDTVHRMKLEKIKEHYYKWVDGKVYPGVIAVDIGAYPNKFFLDTTVNVSRQNKTIPSRCIEMKGKLFFWYDKYYPLSINTINLLDKYHHLMRGATRNADDYTFVIDESIQSTAYYFCRSNLDIYKKIITNKAIGYYDLPNIGCK